MNAASATSIEARYPLTQVQRERYRDQGFIKLKDVLSPDVLAFYGEVITRRVLEFNTMHLPIEQRSTYDRAFLQVMNLWRRDDDVRRFVFGERLARIATELMGTGGVRLYHDQALYKEPAGGFTPWHADQYYWPLESDQTITAWIPLQETPLDMGPLEFSARSNQLTSGRDLKISDESEALISEVLSNGGFDHVVEPFELGEVSFHAGWLFHRAGPNTTAKPRRVMTIIYMDIDMRLKAPENENQELDWKTWCPGAAVGEIIDTPLNPPVYAERPR